MKNKINKKLILKTFIIFLIFIFSKEINSMENSQNQTTLNKFSNLANLPEEILKKIIIHTIDFKKLISAQTIEELNESISIFKKVSQINKKFLKIIEQLVDTSLNKLYSLDDRIEKVLSDFFELDNELSKYCKKKNEPKTLKILYLLKKREIIFRYIKERITEYNEYGSTKVESIHLDWFIEDKGYVNNLFSIIWRDENIVELLLKNNFVDCNSVFSNFALLRSIDSNSFFGDNIIKLLLNYGVDPNIQINGISLVELWEGKSFVLDYSSKNDFIPLHVSISKGNKLAAKLLLDHGAKINIQDQSGNTALMLACKPRIEKGHPFLHIATRKYEKHLVKLLLDYHANPNIQNNNGETALMIAVNERWIPIEIIELLLAHGANPNIQNNKGETALMIAAKKDAFEIVELLLKFGADANVRNNEGKNALSLSDDKKIKELLSGKTSLENKIIDFVKNNEISLYLVAAAAFFIAYKFSK